MLASLHTEHFTTFILCFSNETYEPGDFNNLSKGSFLRPQSSLTQWGYSPVRQ